MIKSFNGEQSLTKAIKQALSLPKTPLPCPICIYENQNLAYFHESRTHLGLEKDCTVSREVQGLEIGEINCWTDLPKISDSVFHLAPLSQAIILFPFSQTQT